MRRYPKGFVNRRWGQLSLECSEQHRALSSARKERARIGTIKKHDGDFAYVLQRVSCTKSMDVKHGCICSSLFSVAQHWSGDVTLVASQ